VLAITLTVKRIADLAKLSPNEMLGAKRKLMLRRNMIMVEAMMMPFLPHHAQVSTVGM
jgi:hypothetical protein